MISVSSLIFLGLIIKLTSSINKPAMPPSTLNISHHNSMLPLFCINLNEYSTQLKYSTFFLIIKQRHLQLIYRKNNSNQVKLLLQYQMKKEILNNQDLFEFHSNAIITVTGQQLKKVTSKSNKKIKMETYIKNIKA